ncbi:hypothetical protein L1987_81656 [Smallanthus sonchifolius]|uniref:Uncharacterized protein n=1 Tax=Smallanthus sonchifolius TaxID=185202 RepID=A0ACB8YR71_9ASTR|nr:hypothetical protein L1987_81656 [Smallanthus sonchifolius]
MRRDFWWREREWRWWREREKRVCEERREERRRRWKWKREEMVVVMVEICGGVRVERAAMTMVQVVVSSIMGSCAKKRDKGQARVMILLELIRWSLDAILHLNRGYYGISRINYLPTLDAEKLELSVVMMGVPDKWILVRAHGTTVELPTQDDSGNSEVASLEGSMLKGLL